MDLVYNTSTDNSRHSHLAKRESNSITIAEDRRTNLIMGSLLDTLTQNYSDERVTTLLRIACEGGPTIGEGVETFRTSFIQHSTFAADVYRMLYPSATAGDALQMYRENPSQQLERIAFEHALQSITLPKVYPVSEEKTNSITAEEL